MATQKVVVERSSNVSASQLKEFFRQIEDERVNGFNLQAFLDDPNRFGSGEGAFDWQKVYGLLDMKAEFKSAKLKFEERPGFWSVPVIAGVTSNKAVAALRKAGVDAYFYLDNLDHDVTKNDRDPKNGSYVVRFKQTVEADRELADSSAEDLAKAGVSGITLLERLLLGLAYFLTTGKHLDTENVTLCSGSRRSGGGVPFVRWNSDFRRVYVSWYDVRDAYSGLRARAAA